MLLKFMGYKKGMAQVFDDVGNIVVCTLLSVEEHLVVGIKRVETDGYSAIILAASPVESHRCRKPQRGFFSKIAIPTHAVQFECRLPDATGYSIGQKIGISDLQGLSFVDVRGVSKGKGYQGVIKRHHFAGGPASHGSGFHRHGGSCGMRSTPGRCLPGQKKAGRMGGEWVSVQSLPIVKMDLDESLMFVKGAVPGAVGGKVYIASSKKRSGLKG